MDDYSFHDKMSSYECGAKVSFDLCNDSSGTCTDKYGSSGAGHYHAAHVGHIDALDRVFMRPYDAATQGAVIAFHDGGCASDSGRFLASSDPSQTAWYNKAAMS